MKKINASNLRWVSRHIQLLFLCLLDSNTNNLAWNAIRNRPKTRGLKIESSRRVLSCCQPTFDRSAVGDDRSSTTLKREANYHRSSKHTLNSDRLVGITLCPARGSHLGSGLYQQLMKSLSEGFISECMGTILNRIPCLPKSPRCIVLSMPIAQKKSSKTEFVFYRYLNFVRQAFRKGSEMNEDLFIWGKVFS